MPEFKGPEDMINQSRTLQQADPTDAREFWTSREKGGYSFIGLKPSMARPWQFQHDL
jgi:hypothetical protein